MQNMDKINILAITGEGDVKELDTIDDKCYELLSIDSKGNIINEMGVK